MSIQRRLAISTTLVLLFSLLVGSALTYRHVIAKVRTEMQAALSVGSYTTLNAIENPASAANPLATLKAVVRDYDGDRHLRATLTAPDGGIIAQSHLLETDDAAPIWFYDIVVTTPPSARVVLSKKFADLGTLRLDADPHNEVAEAWSDMKLTLIIMALFFAAVMILAFCIIRAALAPLRDVHEALLRIGAGDLTTRIAPDVDYELAPLRDGVNAMVARLAATIEQNRMLHEQIIDVQEEERAELARDLHDDVAPFVFAVGADANIIKQHLGRNEIAKIGPCVDTIAEAVRHMQSHLKDVLRRLAPGALLDLGLSGAIDDLIAFWAARRADVVFTQNVTGEPLDPPLDAIAFRIVKESVSNAIRHGNPTAIDIAVQGDERSASVVIEDNGVGLSNKNGFGFGIAGMRQRARSVGGTIDVTNRADCRGVRVEAVLPNGDWSSDAESAAAAMSG